ncbi:hypothetical protein J1614_011190, partial [Plenodomus biglobosus]
LLTFWLVTPHRLVRTTVALCFFSASSALRPKRSHNIAAVTLHTVDVLHALSARQPAYSAIRCLQRHGIDETAYHGVSWSIILRGPRLLPGTELFRRTFAAGRFAAGCYLMHASGIETNKKRLQDAMREMESVSVDEGVAGQCLRVYFMQSNNQRESRHRARLASPGGLCSYLDGWPPSAIGLDSVFLILTARPRAPLSLSVPSESDGADPASSPGRVSCRSTAAADEKAAVEGVRQIRCSQPLRLPIRGTTTSPSLWDRCMACDSPGNATNTKPVSPAAWGHRVQRMHLRVPATIGSKKAKSLAPRNEKSHLEPTPHLHFERSLHPSFTCPCSS